MIRIGGFVAMDGDFAESRLGGGRAPKHRLTKRQLECLEWVHRGFETKEIARELGLSPETVDMHIKNATQRLGVSSRRAAARAAIGTIEVPQSWVHPSSGMPIAAAAGDAEPSTTTSGAEPLSLVDVVGWPLPTAEAPSNQLTKSQRLFWIAAIAVGVLVGFGALISSLEALARLLHL